MFPLLLLFFSSSCHPLRPRDRYRRIASFGALTISISPRSAARCVSKHDRVEGADAGWCEADEAPVSAEADDEDIVITRVYFVHKNCKYFLEGKTDVLSFGAGPF
jgi:hypothetical protein